MASSSADVSITREQLTKYFHLPITDVAKELGICATMLKKICRKNGIPRWPHRKIKSLNKMIESLEASLPNDGSEAGECIRQEIMILKNRKSLIMRNPSILGNSNKRAADGDELNSSKKQRTDAIQQGPVTTFTNPKASMASTTPNSFSINQLLTPSSNFTSSSTLVGSAEEKDYRAYAHHHPHLSSIPPFPDASRSDSKYLDGRNPNAFPSPLSSYLPEDDGRHLETSPLLHPPSTDPYYYHKAALASQYQYHYPRQISYPPPSHGLSASPHHTRNPYYHPFAPHDSPRQQQQHMLAQDATNEQANQQAEQEQERSQQGQNGHAQTTLLMQASSQHSQKQPQQMQRMPQTLQQGQESLPKINLPNTSSDMYKYRNPPSPTTHQQPPYSQGDLGYFYPQYHSQQQRLHQQ